MVMNTCLSLNRQRLHPTPREVASRQFMNPAGWGAVLAVFGAGVLLAGLTSHAQQQLAPLTTFGPHGDGTLRPGDVSFLTDDGNRYQRGMAFNPLTGHLIIVNRYPVGAETINVIDAATGAEIGALDTCCPAFGGSANFTYNKVGVADDGAIYVGNLTTSGSLVTFNLYRWADESSGQTLVFSGDPRQGNPGNNDTRWGDTFAVRGAGRNTEILLATQSGSLVALLRPSDDSLTWFSSTPLTTGLSGGSLGYALAFGPGNTFYGKGASSAGNPLYLLSYDADAGTATVLHNYGLAGFPGRVGAIEVATTGHFLGAIEMTPGAALDNVRLFDISDPAQPPVFLDRIPAPYSTNANAVYSGAVAFGLGNLYALNSDNGIAAYQIVAGTPAVPPVIFQNPVDVMAQITSNIVFTVGVDGTLPLAYQWRFNDAEITGQIPNVTNGTSAALWLTNLTAANEGSYAVVVTNAYGAVTSAVAVLTVLPNAGDLLVYDAFDYPVGEILPGHGGWMMTSGAANGAMEAGNLIVPGLAPARGNRYTWTNSSSVRKPFGEYSDGEVYASFAFRLDTPSTSQTSETTAGFSFGTSTTFPAKLNLIGDGAGGYQFGLYKGPGTSGNGTVDSHIYQAGETVFVVMRYVFKPGVNDDTCDLWLNPDPDTFGAATPPVATIADIGDGVKESAWSYIDRFFWRWVSQGYEKRTADELRIGFSWAEVTPPAPPVLAVALRGNDVVLSWSASFTGFSLEANADVADDGGWEPVGAPVTVVGDLYTVTVPINGEKFFRLKK